MAFGFFHRRFQFHLSTFIVLIFASGLIVGLNVRPYEMIHVNAMQQHSNLCYGWPLPVYLRFVASDMPMYSIGNFSTIFIIINIVFWALLLSVVTWLCEWKIRRNVKLHFGTYAIMAVLLALVICKNDFVTGTPTDYRGPWVLSGWPLPGWNEITADLRSGPDVQNLGARVRLIGNGNPLGILFNWFFCTGLICLVATGTEFLIRCAERKTLTPAPPDPRV